MSETSSAPRTMRITLIEALSFIVCGRFLSLGSPEQAEALANVVRCGDRWHIAQDKLFAAHVAGKITLYGRKAPCFGADPSGEMVSIPREFFLNDVTAGLANVIHNRADADRVMYCDVAMGAPEFAAEFMPANVGTVDTQAPPSEASVDGAGSTEEIKRRAWASRHVKELPAWAAAFQQEHGMAPSFRQFYAEFAAPKGLSRDGLRKAVKQLPGRLRRSGKGSGQTSRQKTAQPRL